MILLCQKPARVRRPKLTHSVTRAPVCMALTLAPAADQRSLGERPFGAGCDAGA